MKPLRIVIDHDEKDIHIECPGCDATESHPINEQRHHMQSFRIIEERPPIHYIETSLVECIACGAVFHLFWLFDEHKF